MSLPAYPFRQITAPVRRMSLPTRVLIIDDDRETTDLFKVILEPNDFDVLVANSGQEGVRLARSMQPDVLVVDMLMPDMDGLAVCQEVRRFSNAPILMLTAFGKPSVMEQALDEGADDYLIKPLSNTLFIASLNKLARRARLNQKVN